MSTVSTEEVLIRIAASGLSKAAKEDVVQLACAIWHEEYVPSVEFILRREKEEQRTIGYLTEFLAAFEVLSLVQIKTLVRVAEEVKEQLHPQYKEVRGLDDIANEWGMDVGINDYLEHILFYQTRHYKHKRS